jgi:hypothetical protein
MNSLRNVQGAEILKRLRQNKKYWAVIFYSGNRIEDMAYAQDLASVLVYQVLAAMWQSLHAVSVSSLTPWEQPQF